MNITLLFTFLGHSGGIPAVENALLEATSRNTKNFNASFSLATYEKSRDSASMPTLILERGKTPSNLKLLRTFLKKQKTDLIFYQYHTFPLFLFGTPYVIKIHDTDGMKSPPAYLATLLNALRARAIVVPSTATKKRVTRAFERIGFGFLGNKIHILPNPLSPVFEKMLREPQINRLENFSLKEKEYFFTLGADDLSFICDCAMKASERPLVIGGKLAESEKDSLIARYGKRLIFTGFVDQPTLAALYAGARATIYKNGNEGFGYIPLESTIAGTPVITNPEESIREVLGDAGHYYTNANECEAIIRKADEGTLAVPKEKFTRFNAEAVLAEHVGFFKRTVRQVGEIKPMAGWGLNDAVVKNVLRDIKARNMQSVSILDLGSGQGYNASKLMENLARLGIRYRITCVDLNGAQFKLRNEKDVTFVEHDLNRDFSFGSFDFITATEIIEHVENPYHFMRNALAHLTPNGTAYLTTPNVEHVFSLIKQFFLGRPMWFSVDEPSGHIMPIHNFMINESLRRIERDTNARYDASRSFSRNSFPLRIKNNHLQFTALPGNNRIFGEVNIFRISRLQ